MNIYFSNVQYLGFTSIFRLKWEIIILTILLVLLTIYYYGALFKNYF